jgi:hypothetical protein
MERDAEKTGKKEKKVKKPVLAGRVSAHKRYLAEGRLEKNRARRAAKHRMRLFKQTCKVLKVPRGTARALRRAELPVKPKPTAAELLIQKNIERVLDALNRSAL